MTTSEIDRLDTALNRQADRIVAQIQKVKDDVVELRGRVGAVEVLMTERCQSHTRRIESLESATSKFQRVIAKHGVIVALATGAIVAAIAAGFRMLG